MEESGQLRALVCVSDKKTPVPHQIGRWVGPRVSHEALEKREIFLHLPGIETKIPPSFNPLYIHYRLHWLSYAAPLACLYINLTSHAGIYFKHLTKSEFYYNSLKKFQFSFFLKCQLSVGGGCRQGCGKSRETNFPYCILQCSLIYFGHRTLSHSKHFSGTSNEILIYETKKLYHRYVRITI
jgi:hypothetical protein